MNNTCSGNQKIMGIESLLPYINQESTVLVGLAFVALGLFLFIIVRKIQKVMSLKVRVTETKWDDVLLSSFGKPLTILILAIPSYYGISQFILTPEGLKIVQMTELNKVLLVLLGAWFLSAFIRSLMESYGRKIIQTTARGSKTDFTARFLGLADLLSVYIIWFVAFLMILNIYQVNLTPFLAGAGIAGIAVALAAQDMLGNFFGGAMIYADRPFKVGDRVKIGEYVGDVLDVGTRSTRIRTLDHELMTIPNSTVSTSIITNYALPDIKIKVRLKYFVSYNSDIEKVKQILLEIAHDASQNFDHVLENPAPEIFFLEFGEHRLDLMLIIWSNRYDRKWETRDYINIKVLQRFREENIEIPYPQRDVYIHERDHSSLKPRSVWEPMDSEEDE
jgi:Small-conductance mechanosensitive channel